jgi:hypothetical protein
VVEKFINTKNIPPEENSWKRNEVRVKSTRHRIEHGTAEYK